MFFRMIRRPPISTLTYTLCPNTTLFLSAAITPEDFGKIPEIVERPDNVERIGHNRIGRELIRYSKRFNGHTYYVEEVRSARKFALQTLYKERTRTSDAATEGQPPTRTPETLPASARAANIGTRKIVV